MPKCDFNKVASDPDRLNYLNKISINKTGMPFTAICFNHAMEPENKVMGVSDLVAPVSLVPV